MDNNTPLIVIAIIVAIAIGLTATLQTRKIQKNERKQRRLNEIIEWAKDVINCSSELNIPLVRGVDRTTMLIYGRSNLYFKYRSVNARSSYVGKIAAIFGMDLSFAVASVTSKLGEFIKILEANINSLEKSGTENEEAAKDCELKLYDLTRALIEKVAEVKAKEEGCKLEEAKEMSEIDVGKELVEIKELLKKNEKIAKTRWIYNLGFAGIIASLALYNINIWGAAIVFVLGYLLMVLSPRLRK